MINDPKAVLFFQNNAQNVPEGILETQVLQEGGDLTLAETQYLGQFVYSFEASADNSIKAEGPHKPPFL